MLNDLEYFSVLVAHALYVPPLALPASLPPVAGYVTRSYSPAGEDRRFFFTEANAQWIDAYREWLRAQPPSPARDSAVGRMLSSADKRANHTSTYQAYLKRDKAGSRKSIVLRDVFR